MSTLSHELPKSRRRYVGAYMVMECFRDIEMPIISVTVTSVAHTPAVAAVRVHPNPFINRLKRGVNIYIVCKICEVGVDLYPNNNVMFIGDVSSIQLSANSNRAEYVINLVDNRRYITELPTYYIKLMRSYYDGTADPPTDTRVNDDGKTIFSLQDQLADANFYGITGKYETDSFYYDVDDSSMAYAFMEKWHGGSLSSYINKMLDPLRAGKGWEPYYVNMNMKKRITDHISIYDDGIFRSDISASFIQSAMHSAVHSIKNAHAELNTTYGDALARLSELGYVFNTNLFPSASGGDAKIKELVLNDTDDPIYQIKSTLFHGVLVAICEVPDGEHPSIVYWPPNPKLYDYVLSRAPQNGDVDGGAIRDCIAGRMQDMEVYSCHVNSRKTTYHAIVSKYTSLEGNGVASTPTIREFTIIPKMYGVLPPTSNWGIVNNNSTFNSIISEPPITALKYNLTDGNSLTSVFSYAYPGGLEVYSYNPEAADDAQGSQQLGTARQVVSKDGRTSMAGTIYDGVSAGTKLYLSTGQALTSTTQEHADRGSYQGGIDIAMPLGTNIAAYAGGILIDKGYGKTTGNFVKIQTEGKKGKFNWWYIHLNKIAPNVTIGNYVVPGEIIGECGTTGAGSTGSHLHLMIEHVGGGPNRALWVNATALFGNTGIIPEQVITFKESGEPVRHIGLYDLSDIATKTFKAANSIVQTTVKVKLPGGGTDVYGKYTHLYPSKHPENENIYGVKRVSTRGDALYELEKITQYVEGGDGTQTPTISQADKFNLLKAKVVQDYHESCVSRNTGSLVIDGLDENVLVGLPYLLYHPMLNIFYYGFVNEVSHKIDNSSGSAYTEIALSSLTTAHSIKEIEDKFAGYTKRRYTGKQGIKHLNVIYARTGATLIGEDDYDKFNLLPEKMPSYQTSINIVREDLFNLMGRGQNWRRKCSIEWLQGYMYGNKKNPHIHKKGVADEVSIAKQWMTQAMVDTVTSIIADYKNRNIVTAIGSLEVTSDDTPSDMTPIDGSPEIVLSVRETQEEETHITGDVTP